MGISGVVAMRLPPRGREHVAGPGAGESVYLWSCKEVDVFYIVELGTDI